MTVTQIDEDGAQIQFFAKANFIKAQTPRRKNFLLGVFFCGNHPLQFNILLALSSYRHIANLAADCLLDKTDIVQSALAAPAVLQP